MELAGFGLIATAAVAMFSGATFAVAGTLLYASGKK